MVRPYDVTVGPDGNLWFTGIADRTLRVTPAGVVTDYYGLTFFSESQGIALGPDAVTVHFTSSEFSDNADTGSAPLCLDTRRSPTRP